MPTLPAYGLWYTSYYWPSATHTIPFVVKVTQSKLLRESVRRPNLHDLRKTFWDVTGFSYLLRAYNVDHIWKLNPREQVQRVVPKRARLCFFFFFSFFFFFFFFLTKIQLHFCFLGGGGGGVNKRIAHIGNWLFVQRALSKSDYFSFYQIKSGSHPYFSRKYDVTRKCTGN